MKPAGKWWLAAVLWLGASGVWAACDGYDTSQWTASSGQQARSCLSDFSDAYSIGKCQLGICKRVNEWRLEKPSQQRALAAPRLLEDVRADLPAGSPDADRLRAAMAAFIEHVKQATPAQIRAIQNRAWVYDQGVLGQGLGGEATPEQIRLGDTVAQACNPPAGAAQCNQALAGAGAVLLHALLYQTVATGFLNDERETFAKYVDTMEQRWTAYSSDSRFQFPWELGLNSVLFTRELDALSKATNGAQGRGLVSPPTSQWILLHPSVGLRYAGDGDRKLDQAVVLEALGYYKWEWSGGEAKGLVGGSLIATWSGSGADQRKGYGFMVHLPKDYSVGLVQERINGKTNLALTLSLDVGKLFQLDGKSLRDKLTSGFFGK